MKTCQHEDTVSSPPRRRGSGSEDALGPIAQRAVREHQVDTLDATTMLILQRSAGNAAVGTLIGSAPSPLDTVLGQAGGMPLDSHVRALMEPQFGQDFSAVRVHADGQATRSAQAMRAAAYTVGNDIVFQRDEFLPGTQRGLRMLAHELTHVAQQRSGLVAGTPQPGGFRLSDPTDRYERAAEANAGRVMGEIGRGADRPLATQARSTRSAGCRAVQRCGAAPCDCSTAENSERLSVQRLGRGEEDEPRPRWGITGSSTARDERSRADLMSGLIAQPRFGATAPRSIQRLVDETDTPETDQPLLFLGAKGPSVVRLQNLLNQAGSANPLLVPDGDFGRRTRARVLAFQDTRGLTSDGVVGPATWSALLGVVPSSTAGGATDSGGDDPLDALFASSGFDGDNDGPALVSGKFPAASARGCGPYTPLELQTSEDSDGQVDPPIGPTVESTALLWDFKPGRTTPRGNHRSFLVQLIADLRLTTSFPLARILLLEGHTDCVDTEGKNFAIRSGRAAETLFLLRELGALEENIGIARAATTGALPGNDAPGEGRARNRSVVVLMADRPIPDLPPIEIEPGPNPKTVPCKKSNDGNSCEWAILDLTSLMVCPGSVALGFVVKNLASNCSYFAEFTGECGGVALSGDISLFPDPERFETFNCFATAGLEGDAEVTAGAVGVPGVKVGASAAFLELNGKNKKPINVGGLDIGLGIPIGVLLATGTFSVDEDGFRIPRIGP